VVLGAENNCVIVEISAGLITPTEWRTDIAVDLAVACRKLQMPEPSHNTIHYNKSVQPYALCEDYPKLVKKINFRYLVDAATSFEPIHLDA